MGGGSLLSGGGDPLKGLKAISNPKNMLEGTAFVLDPGGLLHTSKDEDIAALQARVDIGGIGAKSTVSTREAEKRYKEEITAAQKAAAEEARRVEAQQGIEDERKRRLEQRRASRIERGSLLYGMDQGMGDKLGG